MKLLMTTALSTALIVGAGATPTDAPNRKVLRLEVAQLVETSQRPPIRGVVVRAFLDGEEVTSKIERGATLGFNIGMPPYVRRALSELTITFEMQCADLFDDGVAEARLAEVRPKTVWTDMRPMVVSLTSDLGSWGNYKAISCG